MLVLSRQRDEVITIGPDGPRQVRVQVIDIRRDKVRLGIEAPKDVHVMRAELGVKSVLDEGKAVGDDCRAELLAALEGLYADWQGPLTESMKAAQSAIAKHKDTP